MASPTAPQPTLTEIYLKHAARMLTLVGVLLAIAFCFFASSICIAVVLASFMALMADPAVQYLERLRLPRTLAAGLIVLAGAAVLSVMIYGSYIKLTEFSDNFDVYADRIRELIAPISARVQHVQQSAGELVKTLHQRRRKGAVKCACGTLRRGQLISRAEWGR